jgi:hypothetical protein
MAITMNDKLVLQRAKIRIGKAKAFVLVTWDGETMPVYHYDIRKCTNRGDLRHITMHQAASVAVNAVEKGMNALHERIKDEQTNEKVRAFKNKRSEELSAFIKDERASDPGHDLEDGKGIEKKQSAGAVPADNRPATA